MKKIILLIGIITVLCIPAFSQDNSSVTVILKIHHVTPGRGPVYGGVFFTERAYKKKQRDISLKYEPTGSTITQEITLPAGECLINFFQDLDSNGKCKTGMLGIPKEPVGISDWDGSGIPGSFNKLKLFIDSSTKQIDVTLYDL